MKRMFRPWVATILAFAVSQCSTFSAVGSVDPSFNPAVNGAVNRIVMQSDGKILISGYFTEVNGTARNGLARLHGDGTLDTSFRPENPLPLTSLAIRADGRIFMGSKGLMLQLGPDGARESFVTTSEDVEEDDGSQNRAAVRRIVVQPDNKVLIGGFFTKVNGVERSSLARLNADGSLDTKFNPVITSDHLLIWQVVLQPDGKILVLGDFQYVNGIRQQNFARLNANGTVDSSFVPALDESYDLEYADALSSGEIVVGGDFTATVNGVTRHSLARLRFDGSLDPNFTAEVESDPEPFLAQPGGKVLIIQGRTIQRLNADGSLDQSFESTVTGDNLASSGIYAVALQTDGKVLIGGAFSNVAGTPRIGLARLLGQAGNAVTAGAFRLMDGSAGFEISSGTARTVAVEASTNLIDWITVESLSVNESTVRFQDTNSLHLQKRFYRISWLP